MIDPTPTNSATREEIEKQENILNEWCHGIPAPAWEAMLEINRIAHSLSSLPAPSAGEWVLVPREPTEAMIKAGASAPVQDVISYDRDGEPNDPTYYYPLKPDYAAVAYRAMVSAAPDPEPAIQSPAREGGA